MKSWAISNIFPDTKRHDLRSIRQKDLLHYQDLQDTVNPKELFYQLKNILDKLPKKEITYKESVFPWLKTSISRDQIIVKMLVTMVLEGHESRVDLMLDYRDQMSADTRLVLMNSFLQEPVTYKQKKAIVEFMGDRSSTVRRKAQKQIQYQRLAVEDYVILEDFLRYKSGDLRKNVISVLLEQRPTHLFQSIQRLLAAKDEQKTLAALDLMATVYKDEKYALIAERCRRLAREFAEQDDETSQQAQELVKKITNEDAPESSLANGLGLFDPKKMMPAPKIPVPKGISWKNAISSTPAEIRGILLGFSKLIEEHKDYEYETMGWNGSREKVILGAEDHWGLQLVAKETRRKSGQPHTLADLPLTEVWRQAERDYQVTTRNILEILFLNIYIYTNDYYKKQSWYVSELERIFAINMEKWANAFKEIPYWRHLIDILTGILNEQPQEQIFQICYDLSCYIYSVTAAKWLAEDYVVRTDNVYFPPDTYFPFADAKEIAFWYDRMRENVYDEESFKKAFQVGYAYYRAANYKTSASLRLADFERAYSLGLVDENELYAQFCGRPQSPKNLEEVTRERWTGGKQQESAEKLHEVAEKVVEQIVAIEVKRGDLPTEVSRLASRIYRVIGTQFRSRSMNWGKPSSVCLEMASLARLFQPRSKKMSMSRSCGRFTSL